MIVKNKHVAVALDDSGKCEFLAKVKVIDDREYNRLINEKEQLKSQRKEKELELKNQIDKNHEKILCLDKKLIYLAKSIYDNFVDRGIIENDDEFQQKWYDYFFNNGSLLFLNDLELVPIEYKEIYLKVVQDYEIE